MITLLILAAAAAEPSAQSVPQIADMAQLYEELCLRAFPDDKAVEEMALARGGKVLSEADVKITMGDDPAKAWVLPTGNVTIWIEFPPYHACSVRWSTPTLGSFAAYEAIAAKYETEVGGFQPIAPLGGDQGDIHIHAVGEQRILPNKGVESLFVFDQSISNPTRRAAGDTGFSLRFVHQFAPPP